MRKIIYDKIFQNGDRMLLIQEREHFWSYYQYQGIKTIQKNPYQLNKKELKFYRK